MKIVKYLSLVLLTFVIINCGSAQKPKEQPKNEMQKEKVKPQEITKMNTDSLDKVLIQTNFGDIVIALYEETPLHKANFLKLVNEKFYDGTLFHRIIQGFMIQGGDPNSKTAKAGQQLGNGGTGYTIPAEFNPKLIHKRGAIAAARMGDQVNPQKESSGSQFYIVDGRKYSDDELSRMRTGSGHPFNDEQKAIYTIQGGAPFLDGAYTVFGEVIKGMDVVDKIAAQPKDRSDRPLENIIIISASIIKK
jgi:peptidyl-prolyl cis-trans isomerase B (cyclophilin B)